jgi:hypothetical protein
MFPLAQANRKESENLDLIYRDISLAICSLLTEGTRNGNYVAALLQSLDSYVVKILPITADGCLAVT